MAHEPKRVFLSGTAKLGERIPEWDRYWATLTPEEKVAQIFEIRRIHHEVLAPGTGAQRLDRSVSGTRRLRD